MSQESSEPTKMDLLELDLDVRLSDLWADFADVADEEWTLELAAACMRAAYSFGYLAALVEDGNGDRGKLHYDHGRRMRGVRDDDDA
jgi:hypothetical protein